MFFFFRIKFLASDAVVYMLQVVVGYGLMLAVMSYNVYILTAVALGKF